MKYRLRIFKGNSKDFMELATETTDSGMPLKELLNQSFKVYIKRHKNALVIEEFNTPQEVISHYKSTFQEMNYDSERILLVSDFNDSELLCLTALKIK